MRPQKLSKARFRRRRLPLEPATVVHKEVIEMDAAGNRLFRLPDAAERLAISLNTLKKRIREGKIRACFVGNTSDKSQNRKGARVSALEIERYISANEVAPSA